MSATGQFLLAIDKKLLVGRRDCTKLVDGVLKQVDLVQPALRQGADAEVDVRGMLCFIDADWPLIGGSFAIRGVDVLWARKAAEILKRPGSLTASQVSNVTDHLASPSLAPDIPAVFAAMP